MADGKRWFKVWTSILSDPTFDELPNECAGIWVKLGALIAKHGCNGNITVTKQQFLKRTNLIENALPKIQTELKNVNVDILTSSNGNITVTFSNWKKYQEISDSYARVKKFRDKHNVTVTNSVTRNDRREEKRREEKREENIKKEENILTKHKHGEYKNVLLTETEFKKLQETFKDKTNDWIKKMDEGIETKGYKYKSHYLAILQWSKNEENKPKKDIRLADSYKPL